MSRPDLMNALLLVCVLAYGIYLKMVIRGLRKKIEGFAGSSAAMDAPSPTKSVDPSEVERLRNRVNVLERIATDRENSLTREIEELRDR